MMLEWRRIGSKLLLTSNLANATVSLDEKGEIEYIKVNYAGKEYPLDKGFVDSLNSLLSEIERMGLRWKPDRSGGGEKNG